jgi:hypothetical protein
MPFQNTRRPYVLMDIEPTIALADAARWEREIELPQSDALVPTDKTARMRSERPTDQRELFARLAALLMSWLHLLRASPAPAKTRSQS